jgi:sporulation protein YtfJ
MGHPIESLMKTTMESLKAMVDVNTVVGEPVETEDGTVIMPVSRMSFGFVSGGGDELPETMNSSEGESSQSPPMPFTGGTGAGVTVRPVGFLVVSAKRVRFLPVDDRAMIDRLLDEAPEILAKLQGIMRGNEPKFKEPEVQG